MKGKLAALQREKAELQRERRKLEGQLQSLEHQVEERDRYKYDLTREDWKQLAAEGRVRYRMPCMMPLEAVWKFPEAERERLGLSAEDGDAVAAAQRRSNQRVWTTLRPLCMQIVDDPEVVELLGATSCYQLIEKVESRDSFTKVVEAHRHVAEIHAGIRPPPEPGQSVEPLVDALLVLSSEGRRFEADLAETVGPEEAKRIWQSMSCASTRG